MCDTCIDENHSTHPNKTIRTFCEQLEKIVQNSAENQENIDKAYKAKILSSINSLEKSRYYNVEDLAFLQNKLCEYQEFSVSSQIKRLLSKLAQAKTENRPDDSLLLHKELKKIIKIENNQIIFMQISRANEIRNFELELDKQINKIDQQHKILVDIGRQQRRSNSPDRTNQAHPFDLFLAQNLYKIDKRFLKNESDSVEQEHRLQQYIDQKLAEEKRELAYEINRLQQQIAAYQSQNNDELRRQEEQKVVQNLATNKRLKNLEENFNSKYEQLNSTIRYIFQWQEDEKQQRDAQIVQFQQQIDQNVLNLGNLHTNNAEALTRILKLEEQHTKIQEDLKSLVGQEISKISIINQENQQKIDNHIQKIQEYIDMISSKQLSLSKQQIMEQNGNQLRQQFKNMNQMLKLNIVANSVNLRYEGARNLAAALTEMPQLLVLEVWIRENSIAKEGLASIAQALSTLKNLTHLTLGLQLNSITKEGVASIAQALSTLKKITQLDLRLFNNSIAKEGAASIAQSLSILTKLTHLTLGLQSNSIAKEGVASIAQALSTLKNLTQLVLWLGSNSIAKEGAASIAQALSTLKNLTQLILYLGWNSIGDEGAASLAQAFSTLTNLRDLDLDLRSNIIAKENAASIAKALSTLKNLTQLTIWLGENQIQEEQRQQMLQLLHKIPNKEIII